MRARIAQMDFAGNWRRPAVMVVAGLSAGIAGAMAIRHIAERPWSNLAAGERDSQKRVALSETGERFRASTWGILESLKKHKQGGITELCNLSERVDAWLMTNPVECLNYLAAHDALGLVSTTVLRSVVAEAASQDAVAAIRMIQSIESTGFRDLTMQYCFQTLAEVAPSKGLEQLRVLPDYLRDEVTKSFVDTWARAAPENAVTSLLGDASIPERTVNRALAIWQQKDPRKAFDFLLNLSNEQARGNKDEIVRTFLSGMARGNPALTLQLGRMLPEEKQRMFAADTYGVAFQADPKVAAQEITGRPGALAVIEAVSSACHFATFYRSKSAQSLLDLLPGEQARTATYASIAGMKVMADPQATIEWVATIQDPLARQGAIQGALDNFVANSPQDAVAFASTTASAEQSDAWMDAAAKALVKQSSGNLENAEWLANLKPDVKAKLRASATKMGDSAKSLLQALH